MDAIVYVDGLIQEYLLFRGYVKTYSTFNSERTHDKTSNPEVQIISDQLLSQIQALDLEGFNELWKTLESRSNILNVCVNILSISRPSFSDSLSTYLLCMFPQRVSLKCRCGACIW
jgi:hypothetical protein